MSHSDLRSHKMNRQEARKLLTKIMIGKPHNLVFSRHSREELLKDGLTTVDAINVLKSPDAKILDDAELKNGSYRYRVETKNICIVVVFESEEKLIVVTAWRIKL